MAAKDGTRKITRRSTTKQGALTVYEYWEARLFEDGKQRSFTAPTQREAIAKRTAYLKRKDEGLTVDRQIGKLTLGAYLTRWLDQSIKPYKAPQTYDDYAGIIARHIRPHTISRRLLTALTPVHVQDFINDVAKKTTPKGEPLSPRRVQYIHAVLRAALSRAVKDRLLARNPAEKRDLPKQRRMRVQGLSEEQERAILEAVRGTDLEACVTTTTALGLRSAEVLGLRWRDLDLDSAAPSLTVSGKFRRDRETGRWVFDEFAKSATSHRTLRLPAPVVEALKRHRAASPHAFNRDRPVFTSSSGDPLDGTSVTHRFQKRLTAAGLPRMRFHDLRHGAASLMLSDGADLFVVKEMLGHSQIALTANLYGHLTDKGKQAIADRITARWAKAAAATSG